MVFWFYWNVVKLFLLYIGIPLLVAILLTVFHAVYTEMPNKNAGDYFLFLLLGLGVLLICMVAIEYLIKLPSFVELKEIYL